MATSWLLCFQWFHLLEIVFPLGYPFSLASLPLSVSYSEQEGRHTSSVMCPCWASTCWDEAGATSSMDALSSPFNPWGSHWDSITLLAILSPSPHWISIVYLVEALNSPSQKCAPSRFSAKCCTKMLKDSYFNTRSPHQEDQLVSKLQDPRRNFRSWEWAKCFLGFHEFQSRAHPSQGFHVNIGGCTGLIAQGAHISTPAREEFHKSIVYRSLPIVLLCHLL